MSDSGAASTARLADILGDPAAATAALSELLAVADPSTLGAMLDDADPEQTEPSALRRILDAHPGLTDPAALGERLDCAPETDPASLAERLDGRT